MIKLSFILLILGIILIFIGYSHQIKPTCDTENSIKYINEDNFRNFIKNNATKVFNDMKNNINNE